MMSEYQYYEWQTIDRQLTESEQGAVRALSSHMEVSSSRAVVSYSYGDFKHDARQVLARFFDAHIYLANWGSRRLLFRFPSGVVNPDAIEPCCMDDRITFKRVNGYDVLDMDLSEEEGGDWVESEGSLSRLVSLRGDIIQGDFRCVYLAWLKAMSLEGEEPSYVRKQRVTTPPPPTVPAGLRQLSPSLKRFMEQFDVPRSLVEAAGEDSPERAEAAVTDFRPLVAQLSREKCDEFLCRVAQDDATAAMALKKHLRSLVPRVSTEPEARRSFGELQKRADTIEAARQQRAKETARRKHETEMKALADHEAETWQQVALLVDLKQTKGYEAAVKLLARLMQLADFRGSRDSYRRQANDLCARYKRLSGFTSRVQKSGLLEDQKDRSSDQNGR